MDAEIRPVSADEVETFIRVASAAFHGNPSPEQVEEARVELPEPGRAVGAFVGGRLVATAGDFALELTLPGGGLVPISGLSWVGVLAPHRRQGLLRAMMRHHLDRAHEREEVLGGLTASEGGIYGRFGYGVTSFSTDWELDRQRGGLPRRPEAAGGRVELVDEEGAGRAIPAIQDRARRALVGDVTPAPGWWEKLSRSSDRGHDGMGGKLFALHLAPGGAPDGAAVYRVPGDEGDQYQWGRALARVDHLVAEAPDAYADLWAYLLDLDLTCGAATCHRPVDEPLRWMLADPRQLRVTRVHDRLWARLVDLPAALAARRYALGGSVVIEVADPVCPWNEGRWLVDGTPEGSECRRAGPGEGPQLALDASSLASAYLGGVSVATLVAGGRVVELVSGGAARLGAMLAVDPAPHCSTGF